MNPDARSPATPGVLILAAGAANRYGTPKQLAMLQGRTLVRRAADTALATAIPVWIVTGSEAAQVEAELQGLPVKHLHNPDWSLGMGQTLACGARQLMNRVSALIVMLADQPLVDHRDLGRLLDEHAAHPHAIIAADHGATLGPPCLFPAKFLPALAALSGDRGARVLLAQHADAVRRVPMPNAALDVDTPDDLVRAEAALTKRTTSS